MLNWVKANRKALNAGKLKEKRVEKFRKFLEMAERYKHKISINDIMKGTRYIILSGMTAMVLLFSCEKE